MTSGKCKATLLKVHNKLFRNILSCFKGTTVLCSHPDNTKGYFYGFCNDTHAVNDITKQSKITLTKYWRWSICDNCVKANDQTIFKRFPLQNHVGPI